MANAILKSVYEKVVSNATDDFYTASTEIYDELVGEYGKSDEEKQSLYKVITAYLAIHKDTTLYNVTICMSCDAENFAIPYNVSDDILYTLYRLNLRGEYNAGIWNEDEYKLSEYFTITDGLIVDKDNDTPLKDVEAVLHFVWEDDFYTLNNFFFMDTDKDFFTALKVYIQLPADEKEKLEKSVATLISL